MFCGFIKIHEHQWILDVRNKSQYQRYINMWPQVLSVQYIVKNLSSFNILFRVSTQQQNPCKMVFDEY